MSLCEPGIPKNACHIQRSYEATASKIIVGSRMWPEYIPFQAAGQFFHFQCMQSMLPSIHGNPRCSPTSSNQAISLAFGDRKYSFEKILTIVSVNFFRLSIAVLSPIRMYSSIKSSATPYASILSAAVIFCIEDKPSRLALSLLWTKYGS
ncbi:hypothetical protein CIPAW_01G064300 [Carya illinoinensis]|uniref:Uncharacterized protein n=1 Tax=Carya illinoinensis TaxID=32201 RepID=A0A8T1RHB4_CARIL|nr:hypothetical protein CIPAW_01G064300 [Carya illinoinensis]